MSPFALVLLAAAVLLVVAAEWQRLGARFGADARKRRERARTKRQLKVVQSESDDFARAVERDLAALPTVDEHEQKPR